MRKTKPIVDDRLYTVENAGVRYGPMTREAAFEKAQALVDEWKALGYRDGRPARVFYRDGSFVAKFGGVA